MFQCKKPKSLRDVRRARKFRLRDIRITRYTVYTRVKHVKYTTIPRAIYKGVTFEYGDSLGPFNFEDKKSDVIKVQGDWPKSCLFMYKRICAYCRVNTKNLHTLIFAKLDFTVLCRFVFISCSTPRTASYNYSLEKPL